MHISVIEETRSQSEKNENGPNMVEYRCVQLLYTPAIFGNKITTILVFDSSSLARNGQLDEFVYIICQVSVQVFTLYIKRPDLVML